MSKFNSEWLEQYRRNPRGNNILYQSYANPMGVDQTYNQLPSRDKNPLLQSMFKQGEQEGIPAGEKEREGYLRSLVPENMQNMPLSGILNNLNSAYEGNQRLAPQMQQMQPPKSAYVLRQAARNKAYPMQTTTTQTTTPQTTTPVPPRLDRDTEFQLKGYKSVLRRGNQIQIDSAFKNLVSQVGSVQKANELIAQYP